MKASGPFKQFNLNFYPVLRPSCKDLLQSSNSNAYSPEGVGARSPAHLEGANTFDALVFDLAVHLLQGVTVLLALLHRGLRQVVGESSNTWTTSPGEKKTR